MASDGDAFARAISRSQSVPTSVLPLHTMSAPTSNDFIRRTASLISVNGVTIDRDWLMASFTRVHW
jgi:hypothetical protein